MNDKEKIALNEFAEKFFGIKPKQYQRDMIKLITDGKTKRLKFIPMRPTTSYKYTNLIDRLIEENKDVCNESFLNAITKGQSFIKFNPNHRPMMVVIDDIEAPHRNSL